MNAVTGFLRAAAREGVELAAATRRFVTERFGDLPDTPENVARIQRAVRRVEPPERLTASSFNARAQVPTRQAQSAGSPASTARRLAEAVQTAQAPSLAARPQRPLAARPTAAPVEQPLALPAPAEPMPSFAVKPSGGQWFTRGAGGLGAFSPEIQLAGDPINLGFSFGGPSTPEVEALDQWLRRALPRYLKNDFGTAADPLRELAPQAGMVGSADEWSDLARQTIMPFPIGSITLPENPLGGMPSAGARQGVLDDARRSMPWLASQPVTDNVYGLDLSGNAGALNFAHVADEMYNAMRPEISGIPADLAVRPESLQRMAFPQAVERVGRINQWRAAQQAEASLAAQDNPALRTFREYAEDNPRGLRWMEIAAPEAPMPEGAIIRPVEGWDDMVEIVDPRTGMQLSVGTTEQEARRLLAREERQQQLQDALTYEGDTMGHCVGGYCDDVQSGRTRIFSLRDPAGQPFVTVETRPRSQTFSDLVAHLGGDRVAADDYFAQGFQARDAAADSRSPLAHALELAGVPPTQDIIQIKGSGKRQGQQQLRLSSRGYEDGPDDYLLPFVQDFVKQGQWGNIGDLGNTGLTRLPDGRYITLQQAEEGIAAIPETSVPMQFGLDNTAPTMMPRVYDPTALDRLAPEEWEGLSQYFQGYAIGGRVDPERCFTRHRLSVKR